MHEVISAFIDNEPFDGDELSVSLATPEGRELLLDLIAMRGLATPAPKEVTPIVAPARHPRWMWLTAAAVFVALAVGYQAGRWPVAATGGPGGSAVGSSAPPSPTSEFRFEPGVNWTDAPSTGGN